MNFSTPEIAAWVGSFMWPFARISALVATMPLFGTDFAPMRVRLYLALALTLGIVPTLPPMPQIDALSGEGVMVIAQQLVIGVSMGFFFQLIFAGFIIGGQTIAMKIGLGFSTMVDPIAGSQVPVLGMLYTILVGLLFLAFDGHLMVFELLADSFRLLPVGTEGIGREGFWEVVAFSGRMFRIALMMAITVIASLLVVMLAFGVVTKAAPQFNIFSVGMPIFMMIGFVVITITLPDVVPHFVEEMRAALETARKVVSGIP
ncbi:flagellar biosynthetic protein FliR [Endothiovibrio diazotrophicus]